MLRNVSSRLSRGDWLPVLWRLPQDEDAVGLTFDDGPSAATTPEILRVLRARGATATFFVLGENAQAHPQAIRDIVADGHDVFSHGWQHICYDRVPSDALLADLRRTEAVLARFRPSPSPYLVRLPYGAGHATASVHRTLRRWHKAPQIADWVHTIEDWRLADGCTEIGQVQAACRVAADKLAVAPDLRGAILLLHDDPFGVSAPLRSHIAPLLLTEILDRLDGLGLRARKLPPLGARCPLRRFVRS